MLRIGFVLALVVFTGCMTGRHKLLFATVGHINCPHAEAKLLSWGYRADGRRVWTVECNGEVYACSCPKNTFVEPDTTECHR